MKFFFHINLIFLVSILTSNTFAQNQIVADLSQENVKIATDFQGAKILLFGAYDGKKGDDIIVIVTGPKGLVTVQKKEKILGVWVNTRKVNYINTPKYLSISSNRKIDDILNKKTQNSTSPREKLPLQDNYLYLVYIHTYPKLERPSCEKL